MQPDVAVDAADAEKVALARVTKGEKFPDINGTNAKIREILAAQAAR